MDTNEISTFRKVCFRMGAHQRWNADTVKSDADTEYVVLRGSSRKDIQNREEQSRAGAVNRIDALRLVYDLGDR